MNAPILAPAAVLVLWSLIMLFWMAGTRLPAIKASGIDTSGAVGTRGKDIEALIPGKPNWAAHNYEHLMEQPTIFYAAVVILTLVGAGAGLNLWLAWGYVGLRIAHSVWQATVNTVSVRFPLFLASTLCLLGLAINAVRATVGA